MSSSFSQRVIAWQCLHGRHDLPWQNTRDPYAIWVSEIMLQQTQVSAVIPYYLRFMARFPDIPSLAGAEEDEVLRHWSGLGYYSRARNLHTAAQVVMGRYGGVFPREIDAIQTLPGIGRSTAAAIAVFSFGQRQAILDGNVKRVLTRYYGIEGWPGQPAVEKRLWALADSLLPTGDIEAYTQGLMDMGATLCGRSKPACHNCPLDTQCVARQGNRIAELPAPKPYRTIPQRETTMLLLLCGNEILLEKRPSTGIWGGLWSLPEVVGGQDVEQVALVRYGLQTVTRPAMTKLTHTFTHFRLQITPQPLLVTKRLQQVLNSRVVWLDIEEAQGAALPTPVRKLLDQLRGT
jgi:A/G-specific adenine glycosylase